jgi:hypothetical protein
MTTAERLDRYRILVLLTELRRLTQRETEVRRELAELLEQPRSPAVAAELGKFLQRLGETPRP